MAGPTRRDRLKQPPNGKGANHVLPGFFSLPEDNHQIARTPSRGISCPPTQEIEPNQGRATRSDEPEGRIWMEIT